MRVFTTPGFARAAPRAGITSAELCMAAQEIVAGLAVDLGGGVCKKRLNQNLHRAIILARGARYSFFVYLYAKQDQADIDPAELHQFRKLAKGYAPLTAHQLATLLHANDLKKVPCDTS